MCVSAPPLMGMSFARPERAKGALLVSRPAPRPLPLGTTQPPASSLRAAIANDASTAVAVLTSSREAVRAARVAPPRMGALAASLPRGVAAPDSAIPSSRSPVGL